MDDIVDRLYCSYADPPCEQCTFCAARDEIERLRALCNDLHHDATCTESFCRLCGEGIREWEARRG